MPRRTQPASGDWGRLVDPDTGRLRASIPLDVLIVPAGVELDRGVLRFSDWQSFTYLKPPPALLERFLELRTDDAILRFAKRYGPLPLSERDGTIATPWPFHMGRPEHREPLEGWRRYQWEFNALLTIAAALREKTSPRRGLLKEFQERDGISAGSAGFEPRSLADLMLLGPGEPARGPSFIYEVWDESSAASADERLAAAATFLQARTDGFIQCCRLRPALTFESTQRWPPSRPALVFKDSTADWASFGLSLFGALTVQLLAAATGSGFAMCSACGAVFVPRGRNPAFGKRRYCRACGREAAVRDAKAEYRAKLRNLGVRRMRDLRSGNVKRRGKTVAAKQRSGK